MKEKIKGFFNHRLIKYTIIFLIVAIFIEALLILNGRELISNTDGINQHFVNLIHYRRILMNLIHGGGFSTFAWGINLGMDLFANYSYYIFGDLFNLFSLLSTRANLENVYELLIFVRIYFIGLSFMVFAKYNKLNDNASILGGIIYAFCNFTLQGVIRHPFFANGMILFPLLMIGIQKIVRENKKIFYTLIVASTFMVSFYFGYMLAICIAIYGTIIIIIEKKKDGLKEIIKKFIQVGFYSIIAVGISSIILLPTINQFLSSSRTGDAISYVYNINYYHSLFTSLISTTSYNWVLLGAESLILVILPIAFKKFNKYKEYILLLIILLVPLLIPSIGSLFAGFSFPNNRWSFVIPFILSFFVASEYNDGFNYKKSDFNLIYLFLIIYSAIIVLVIKAEYKALCIALIIAITNILIIKNKKVIIDTFKYKNLFDVLLIGFNILGLFIIINNYYSVSENNYLDEYLYRDTADIIYYTNNFSGYHLKDAINYLKSKDKDYYRINKYHSARELENFALYYNTNSIYGYLSIINDNIENLSYDLDNYNYHTSEYLTNINNRTKINTLLGSKYYISEKPSIFYGYEKIHNIGKTNIYLNNYYVPFGTLYTQRIDEKDYNKYNALERESSLLKYVVLDKDNINDKYTTKVKGTFDIKDIDYSIDRKNYQNIKVNKINDKDNTFNIHINEKVDGELYLIINNHQFKATSKKEKMKNFIDEKKKKVDYYKKNKERSYNKQYLEQLAKKEFRNYNNNNKTTMNVYFKDKTIPKAVNDLSLVPYKNFTDNHVINLGYYNEKIDEDIKVSVYSEGTYKNDGIEIKEVAFKNYEKEIENLRQSNFEVIEYKNNYMIAKANPIENGVLQFSTIYDDSWDVYVDNKKVNTMKVNNYFLGIYIDKGEHNIKLVHHTKYLKEGLYITIASIIVFIVCIIINKRKGRIKE